MESTLQRMWRGMSRGQKGKGSLKGSLSVDNDCHFHSNSPMICDLDRVIRCGKTVTQNDWPKGKIRWAVWHKEG